MTVADTGDADARLVVRELRRVCDAMGAVLICDDVRSSLRLDLRGSWAPYGVDPDLTCLCKGLANGYLIACVLGREGVRAAVASMAFMTVSFWCNADAFAAALATVRTMKRTRGVERLGALPRAGGRAPAGLSRFGASADALLPLRRGAEPADVRARDDPALLLRVRQGRRVAPPVPHHVPLDGAHGGGRGGHAARLGEGF